MKESLDITTLADRFQKCVDELGIGKQVLDTILERQVGFTLRSTYRGGKIDIAQYRAHPLRLCE